MHVREGSQSLETHNKLFPHPQLVLEIKTTTIIQNDEI